MYRLTLGLAERWRDLLSKRKAYVDTQGYLIPECSNDSTAVLSLTREYSNSGTVIVKGTRQAVRDAKSSSLEINEFCYVCVNVNADPHVVKKVTYIDVIL